MRGKGNDRDGLGLRRLLELLCSLPAREHRQAQIHQDEIRFLASCRLDALLAVPGHDHLIAVLREAPAEHVDVVLVIFDVEDLRQMLSPLVPLSTPAATRRQARRDYAMISAAPSLPLLRGARARN